MQNFKKYMEELKRTNIETHEKFIENYQVMYPILEKIYKEYGPDFNCYFNDANPTLQFLFDGKKNIKDIIKSLSKLGFRRCKGNRLYAGDGASYLANFYYPKAKNKHIYVSVFFYLKSSSQTCKIVTEQKKVSVRKIVCE